MARRDTGNKQHNLNVIANSINSSPIESNYYSRAPRYNVKNEIIDCLEDSRQTEETIANQSPNMIYAENSTEEDWDYNVMDLLQVECNDEFSDSKEMCDDIFKLKRKVYPIENKCVICYKTFSCQREFAKHAQQLHPNEKAFRCLHCPSLFSKFKSVTAHFNRSHIEPETSKHIRLEPKNRSGIRQVDNNVGEEKNVKTSNEDIFSNRKGKIYPVENKCAICDKSFSSQRDIVQHSQDAHPNAKVFKCLYCPTVFSKLKSVTTHYKRSHSKLRKTIICEYCNKAFFTQFLLERHRRAHTEQRPFACHQCDKTYKYKRNLLVHIKTHTKDSNSIAEEHSVDEYCENEEQNEFIGDEYCENEEQNLFTENEFCDNDEQNLLTENGEEGINISELASAKGNFSYLNKLYPFKCNECDRAYKHKKNLIAHQTTHWQNNEVTETIILDDSSANEEDSFDFNNSTYFIIDELNTDSEHFEDFGQAEFVTGDYTDEYDYEDYDSVHMQNSSDMKQNECGICMKVFKCQQAVAKHLQRCHAEIEFFKCPYCDDNFYSLDTLSKHITIKKHPQKKNVCEMCLKSFDRRSDMRRHIRIHTDERPYCCDICNKKFTQSNQLKRHREVNHINPKKPQLKFPCNLCTKSFLSDETLKRHISIHERQTEFPCSMCFKTFKTRYDWHRHQETHSSRKNLTCEFCLQSFSDIQILNRHLKDHTGERKYLCTVCDKTYKEKSHLVNHRRIHDPLVKC